MAKSIDDITHDAIEEGGYLCLLYFDMHAQSAEEVKNILVGFIAKLTKEQGVIYALGEIDNPMERDGMHSSSAEVKMLVKDFPCLARICSQYAPIAIEILRPHSVKLELGEAQDVLLTISQVSQSFTDMIMNKVLSKEEKESYAAKLSQKAQIGKQLLEKKGKKQE